MPLYTKFLKDLLTRKGKYINNESIMVEGNCSPVILTILPQKFKDPGSVTIPWSIGDVLVGKTLIDLGASINLMPFSMCWRIRNLRIAPTRMTLQLANHSITRPYGVVEDVLVKVCQFTFLVDFVIHRGRLWYSLNIGLTISAYCKMCYGNGEWQLRDKCGGIESNLQLVWSNKAS